MYNQIDKWNGVMPKVTSGNSSSLLIDIPVEENNSSQAEETE